MDNTAAKYNGILLLSTGSKVAITRIAKQAAMKRGLCLHASDRIHNVPTKSFADAFIVFGDEDRSLWINSILDYCNDHKIGLVIPTRHGDLPFLASASDRFKERGIGLSISSSETISICNHKINTFEFLRKINCPTPETTTKPQLNESSLKGIFPLFAKPSDGAGSVNLRVVRNKQELETVFDNWAIQRFVDGPEYTTNIYLDRSGKSLCAIPHLRIAVESGEVSQARTERQQTLIDLSKYVAEQLPAAHGIINIQAILDRESNAFQIIEINPRIGGGYPLADQAKGHYIEWLCREWLEEETPETFDKWTENLTMNRYRDAIFTL